MSTTALAGLSLDEARRRLDKFGRNEIREIGGRTPIGILLRQVRSNFVLYLLAAAAIIAFAVGETVTGFTVGLVILVVTVVGFAQEYRSERAVQALRNMLRPISVVRREGRDMEIPSAEVVPGDVLVLRTGERVPADAEIIEQKDIRLNEAVLTGESQEVKKQASQGSPGRHETTVFMGSFVVYGRCVAKVIHTGMNTRFGQISRSISTATKALPLQEKVNRIGRTMVIVGVIAALCTGAVLFARATELNERTVVDILVIMIALSVSVFPEGFPLVLLSTLATGAHRMARQNAIVNRMSIIETLGETTVVCADKTGTMTRGEMTVIRIVIGDREFQVQGTGYEALGKFMRNGQPVVVRTDKDLMQLLKAAVLCNDANIERTGDDHLYRVLGTATEGALMVLGAKAGVFRDDLNAARVEEIPFSSERKMMSVMCQESDGQFVYVKGAPEVVLNQCTSVVASDGIRPLTSEEKTRIQDERANMAHDALRTLALAYKPCNDTSKDHFEEDLIFLGLVGMEDAPRPEVSQAVKDCLAAGVKVKMITGDHQETAVAIGRQVGIIGESLLGAEIDAMTDDELVKRIPEVAIVARVRPEHKLRIVRALQRLGEVVTMTGDGVNDAPALKEAQIGIAMGKNGTDVSRSVADLTLKDDNFASIVSAIREGRVVFRNIRKFVTYQLSCNIAEVSIVFVGMLVAPLLGWPVPLLVALQILFMNLVTDNLPALTLGFNPASFDLMEVRPRRTGNILTRPYLVFMLGNGILTAGLVLGAFAMSHHLFGYDAAASRTIALVTLICLEIAAAFSFRSFRKGVLSRSLMVNRWLVYASLVSLAATLAIVYTDLGVHFETVPITAFGWLIAGLSAFVLWVISDAFKVINNRSRLVAIE